MPASPSDETTLLRRGEAALTVDRLLQLTESGAHYLDVAVPIGIWDLIGGDVEAVNDQVSELITGSTCGLQDIAFSRYTGPVPEGAELPDSEVYLRVVAGWSLDMFDQELADYLDAHFAWVYPDEDGDHIKATVNLTTGSLILHGVPAQDIFDPSVRVRLELVDSETGDLETMVDVEFDKKSQRWRVEASALAELRDL